MFMAWLVTATILATGEVEVEETSLAPFPDRVTCDRFAEDVNKKLRVTPGAARTAALAVCKEDKQ